jgi:hypothetical protein
MMTNQGHEAEIIQTGGQFYGCVDSFWSFEKYRFGAQLIIS